jgi:hypothetical protein
MKRVMGLCVLAGVLTTLVYLGLPEAQAKRNEFLLISTPDGSSTNPTRYDVGDTPLTISGTSTFGAGHNIRIQVQEFGTNNPWESLIAHGTTDASGNWTCSTDELDSYPMGTVLRVQATANGADPSIVVYVEVQGD